MTEHIKTKNKIKKINSKTTFNNILEDSMLSDVEKEFMKLYYVERKDLNYIADILGYSKPGISKMHKRILKNLESLL